MRPIVRPFAIAGLSILLLLSCALRSYLKVDYQVPAASDQLAGRKVRLAVEDRRTDFEVLTPSAAAVFDNFRNYYDLILVNPKKSTEAGVRDLPGLFQSAFEWRLLQAGAAIAPPESTADPLLQIAVDRLKIDLQHRKWFAEIRYEASVYVDNQLIGSEVITGKAERPRAIGRDGIEENLGGIFSDSVNRLDIARLLAKANKR